MTISDVVVANAVARGGDGGDGARGGGLGAAVFVNEDAIVSLIDVTIGRCRDRRRRRRQQQQQQQQRDCAPFVQQRR